MASNKCALLAATLVAIASIACSSETAAPSDDDPDRSDAVDDPPQTLPADYESMAGCAKQRLLFDERVVPSAYQGDFLPSWDLFNLIDFHVVGGRMLVDRVSDENPADRSRIVHKLGTVATVEVRSLPDNPYSGLFQGGCGLVRLSLTFPVSLGFTYLPGAAIKLFVDGKPSENLMALQSLDGQGDNHNFFANPLSTVMPAPKTAVGKIVDKGLARVADSRRLDMGPLARIRADGAAVAEPVIPAHVLFVPTAEVQRDPRPGKDFRREIATIQPGTVLYQVFASDTENGPTLHIADVVTTSSFVASEYGDEILFFRHPAREN